MVLLYTNQNPRLLWEGTKTIESVVIIGAVSLWEGKCKVSAVCVGLGQARSGSQTVLNLVLSRPQYRQVRGRFGLRVLSLSGATVLISQIIASGSYLLLQNYEL
jgi:hypothetical protein